MKRITAGDALKLITLSLIILLNSQAIAEPVDIDSRRELFVDRLLIDQLDNVTLKLHQPVKAPRPRSPLPVRHMMTVIKNGDRFQAWWRGSDPDYQGDKHTGHPGETVHYAVSQDGHEWACMKWQAPKQTT